MGFGSTYDVWDGSPFFCRDLCQRPFQIRELLLDLWPFFAKLLNLVRLVFFSVRFPLLVLPDLDRFVDVVGFLVIVIVLPTFEQRATYFDVGSIISELRTSA